MTTNRPVRSTSIWYRALARAGNAAIPLAARFSPKLARGDEGRRRALDAWEKWSAEHRDRSRPLVWCHAPSVGEGLQAEAVLRLLRASHPDWQIVYSFFSPSAEALARRMPVDFAGYLPYDTRPSADRMLAALVPRALVFTKLDLWPELATRAAFRGAAVGLIAATVSGASGRLRWPSRSLTRPGYAAVALAGAIDDPDARRLRALGTDPARVTITGDPRFDSAIRRADAPLPDESFFRSWERGKVLVAGSTWPADEAVLLPAFARLRHEDSGHRLILVPHEPTPAHLAGTTDRCRRLGLSAPVPMSAAVGTEPLVVVDRVGQLAALYHLGSVAYVGGGFGRAGLHSVLEPAACRRPVLIGPRWQASRDAALLIDVGGAVALPSGGQSTGALVEIWRSWMSDLGRREAAGHAARKVVEDGRGADQRNAAIVERLVAGETA